VNRVHSTGTQLFDSEIRHNDYVFMRFMHATRQRHMHRDHIMEAHEPVILEVTMSMSQWGAFVSSFGSSGVPCTIERQEGRRIEPEEREIGRLELTAKEVAQKTRTAVAPIAQAFREVEKAVESNAGKKAVTEALRHLRAQIQNMPANTKFAADSLAEHAEAVVTKARADIEGMVMAHAERLGIDPADAPRFELGRGE
jgi:hypothetical protein